MSERNLDVDVEECRRKLGFPGEKRVEKFQVEVAGWWWRVPGVEGAGVLHTP